MKTLITTVILIFIAQFSYAQRSTIVVISDAALELKLEQKIASVDTVDRWGYRIQIYFGSNRKAAVEQEKKFKSRYPELRDEVYTDYFQPNWKVRVGNFYRKIDSQQPMNKFENEFGDVFLVRDIIELPIIK